MTIEGQENRDQIDEAQVHRTLAILAQGPEAQLTVDLSDVAKTIAYLQTLIERQTADPEEREAAFEGPREIFGTRMNRVVEGEPERQEGTAKLEKQRQRFAERARSVVAGERKENMAQNIIGPAKDVKDLLAWLDSFDNPATHSPSAWSVNLPGRRVESEPGQGRGKAIRILFHGEGVAGQGERKKTAAVKLGILINNSGEIRFMDEAARHRIPIAYRLDQMDPLSQNFVTRCEFSMADLQKMRESGKFVGHTGLTADQILNLVSTSMADLQAYKDQHTRDNFALAA